MPIETAVKALTRKGRAQFALTAFAPDDFDARFWLVVQVLLLVSNPDANPISFASNSHPLSLKFEGILSRAGCSRSYLKGRFVRNPAHFA